jgi:hypothetical protein
VSGGAGAEKVYAAIDPDNAFDEMHDEDDLIDNNIGYGLLHVAGADYLDPGLRVEQAYQSVSYQGAPGLGFALYMPTTNQNESIRYELIPTSIGGLTTVGDPIQVLAFRGGSAEPENDHSFDPTPAAMMAIYRDQDLAPGMDETQLKLYRLDGVDWFEATCPGYELVRFPDDNRIAVPICQVGTFVLTDPAPGPILAPEAEFSATPTSGPIPLTVNFTDQSTNYPDTWLWDFGDGGTSDLPDPFHIYTVPGIYTVTLSVSNAGGSDTEIKPDYITATGLLAAFSAAPVAGSVPLTVTFTDQSVGIPGPINWDWGFGEGGSSAEQHPEYTYTAPGTFTVTLTVSNGEGSDALTVPDCITVGEEPRIYLPLVLRNP